MITYPTILLLAVIFASVTVLYYIFLRLYQYLQKQDFITQLTQVIASEMNLVLLEKKVVNLLSVALKISTGDFILVSDFVARPLSSLDSLDSPNIKFASLEKKLHEIKRIMVYEKISDPVDKEIFKSLNIRLILPLFLPGEDIGLLIMGPKIKGHYSSNDIRLLETIAPQLTLALKNADSYRKIQEFSQTLERKVIERTHELEILQNEQLKLKDEFVFIATHDLSTPVTAISGFTALINNSKENLSPTLKNYLAAITEASSRLTVLVNDLLEVARSDSGTIKLELQKIDASKIIEAAVREITPQANKRRITISLSLAPDNIIQADPMKLSEIIENILSNGIKYNRDDGKLIVSSHTQDNQYILEIADTGLGIPKSEQSQVFTKFFRSETSEARKQPGTGLGLFVARMLSQKMGGHISFESVEGEGTTFRLIFNR
jgi:signal transduction histidine kinase